jgi:hypothetical protein
MPESKRVLEQFTTCSPKRKHRRVVVKEKENPYLIIGRGARDLSSSILRQSRVK